MAAVLGVALMLVGQTSPAALQAAAPAELDQAGEGRPGPAAPGVVVNPHRLPAATFLLDVGVVARACLPTG